MTEINLLPWREKKREFEKKQFVIYLMVGLVGAALVVFVINFYATHLVALQTERNQRLTSEITVMDHQILEIKNLKKFRQALVARMNIIQNLQATRTLTVHLMDEVIKIIPEGVFLSEIGRVGDKVTILGFSESNTNISQLMRSIQSSIWIEDPELTEIKKSTDVKEVDENEFKLSFVLKSRTQLGAKI
ncbi:MAG: PilN domain-containing protein [Legionellales bacterium]|nr:PilN domain-containing protein [Legionellales bacterium]